MDSGLTRIIVLCAGIALGIMMMGCTGQNMTTSQATVDGKPVEQPAPSFTQFNDMPVPTGASMDLERSLLLGSSEEWTGRLVFSTSVSSASVFDLYKAEMVKYGWTELTVIRGERSIMAYQRGQRIATIEIHNRTLSGAQVSITVSPNASGSGRNSYGGSSSISRTPLK